MRVYLPVSWAQLEELTRGPLEVLTGHAVTDEVRAELDDSDDEELEYVVLGLAASDALALVTDPLRRVVLAVDTEATPTGALSEVSLRGPVALSDVAAVHIDADDAADAVRAALEAPDDDSLAERVLEHELGWYAVQEISSLLG